MKISYHWIKTLGAGSVVAIALGLNTCVLAGPGSQFWITTKPVTTSKEAAAVKPHATVAMVCTAGKTVLIRDTRHVGPLGEGIGNWYAVGSKHQCDRSGGEVMVVKGKTTDSIQHNGSIGGQGAAFCCVAPSPDRTPPEKKAPEAKK